MGIIGSAPGLTDLRVLLAALDPEIDPVPKRFLHVSHEKARERMVSTFDLENTIPDWALCFRFDIVLRGREATPQDADKH